MQNSSWKRRIGYSSYLSPPVETTPEDDVHETFTMAETNMAKKKTEHDKHDDIEEDKIYSN